MNTETIELMDIKEFEAKRFQNYIREKNFLEVKKLDADTFEVLNPAKNVSYIVRKQITDSGIIYAECSCRDFQGKGMLYDPPGKCKHVWACIDFSKNNGKAHTSNDVQVNDNSEDIKINEEEIIMCKTENKNINSSFNPEKYLTKIKKTEKGQPVYKDYLEVKYRVHWFRSEHPSWDIKTEIIKLDTEKGVAVIKADVFDDNGKHLATGLKLEYQKNFFDYIEKCETGAIGRALSTLGYGTLQCFDLDEDVELGRIADSPVSITPPSIKPSYPIPETVKTTVNRPAGNNGNNGGNGNGKNKQLSPDDMSKYVNRW